MTELLGALEHGAGAAVIGAEALEGSNFEALCRWIDRQPSWADFPIVYIADPGPGHCTVADRLGNVIVLERPQTLEAVAGAVANGLRGRRRQYRARADLDALLANEARLSIALKTGHLGTWQLDIASGQLDASEMTRAHFGRGAEEAFGFDALLAAVAPDDRGMVETTIAAAIAEGGDRGFEYRVLWPDGTMHWVDMRASVLPDRYGRAITVAGVTSDITARKTADSEREALLTALATEREHTQEALRGERAFSGQLLYSVPAGIVAYDTSRAVTTWNPVMERLTGLKARDAVGMKLAAAFGSAAAEMEARLGDALAGRPGAIEEIELQGESGPLFLETQHAPLMGGDGQISGGVAFFRDVTERRRAQEQLSQAQKMELIGQLTGGVAHDFNNLLTAVQGNLELLRKKLPQEPPLLRHIEAAMQGAQRGAALTQRLLAFARRQDLKPAPTDLVALVENTRGLLERSLGTAIEVAVEVAPDAPPALVDPAQLELALLNLAFNARDAMPEGGRLTMTLDRKPPPASARLTGDFVRVGLGDTGEGMDRETLARAIDPFFSTKELGKGTGLGLSMVHGLAVQLGGALVLTSVPGQGTQADLYLPVAAEAVVVAAPEPVLHEEAPASSVLVVDDDVLIAMNTVDMVQDLGHSVLEANSGRQALDILLSGARVDAIVTDYAMPGMTGVELADRVWQMHPEMPILLATGYADLPDGTTSDLPRLAKPYLQSDLAQHLTRMLSARSAPK